MSIANAAEAMRRLVTASLFLALAAAGQARAATARGDFAYALADSTGDIDYGPAALAWDPYHSELYAIASGRIDVFNANGMRIYSFGEEGRLGTPIGLAVDPAGDLFVLAFSAGKSAVVRCNFRGEPIATLALKGVPAHLARGFRPNALAAAGGRLYLADKHAMRVVVVDAAGAFAGGFDLFDLLRIDGKSRNEIGMRGFGVDRDGNILFTISELFAAYVVAPDGSYRSFGIPGSAPGKFNVVAGITADDRGNLYVTDVLRSVVMVFDPSFELLGEFGYRGTAPGSLRAPANIAVAPGRVFVSQSRGAVKAFGVRID